MPVQFTCSHCHRRLSVAHRKAGTTVACPKCGHPNVVPGSSVSQVTGEAHAATLAAEPQPAPPPVPEPPQAPPAKSSLPEAGPAFEEVLQFITEQDTGTAAPPPQSSPPPREESPASQHGNPRTPREESPIEAASAVAAPPPAPPVESAVVAGVSSPIAPPPLPPLVESRLPPVSSAATRTAATRRRHDDGTVLMLTRKAVYAQAVLAGGLTLLAFLAGLTIGRSSRPAGKPERDGKQAAGEPVPLEGYVLYSLSPGHSMPDAGAIVIALPAGKTSGRKLAARGLHPGDGDDLSAVPAIDDLRSLGGAVARADERGQFQLVVPKPGDFSILIVSRRSKRPSDQTIAMSDQQELARVFASPSDLIGEQRYAIVSRRLAGAPPPYTHEFGPTDKS